MKAAANQDSQRRGLLKRNLLLVFSYLVAMLIIAGAYAG